MKGKTMLLCAAALLVALAPGAGFAQRAGFQVGIAPQALFGTPPIAVGQPQFGFFPAAPAVITPPFAVAAPAPLIPTIPAVIAPQPVVIVPQFPSLIVPAFPTVMTPNHVLLPGQTVIAPPIITPGQTIVAPPIINPPATVFFPANPIQPSPPFVPRVNQIFPVIGIPRAQVISQFGQPSVTVITSTGETLFFPGGATVILQNGRVVGAK